VRLRDTPSAVHLLRNCPNELAIAIAISSDPTDWICGCFRDKGTRVKPKPEWVLPFIYRLVLEKPAFEITPELGATFMWIVSKSGDLVADRRLSLSFEMEAVQKAVKQFLAYCEIRLKHIALEALQFFSVSGGQLCLR
jgi:hypothetical protein